MMGRKDITCKLGCQCPNNAHETRGSITYECTLCDILLIVFRELCKMFLTREHVSVGLLGLLFSSWGGMLLGAEGREGTVIVVPSSFLRMKTPRFIRVQYLKKEHICVTVRRPVLKLQLWHLLAKWPGQVTNPLWPSVLAHVKWGRCEGSVMKLRESCLVYCLHCANLGPSDSFCGLRNGLGQSINNTFTIILISPGGDRRLNCSASRIGKVPGSWAWAKRWPSSGRLWNLFCLESLERGLLLSQLGGDRAGTGQGWLGSYQPLAFPSSLPPLYAIEKLLPCTGHHPLAP